MRRSAQSTSSQIGPPSTRWLSSYANFTTILVALFAFLLVNAELDSERLGVLSETIQTVLGSTDVSDAAFSEPDSVVSGMRVPPAPEVDVQAANEVLLGGEPDLLLRGIEEALVRAYANQSGAELPLIVSSPEWVMLLLASDRLFAPGDTNLRVDGEDVLYVVAQAVHDQAVVVSVGAHTDDQLASAEASWQLSSRRAAAIARYLQREGIAPQRITAQGYGSFQPWRPNDTADNRAANRRIEILISMPWGN